jgi:aminopeptidase C
MAYKRKYRKGEKITSLDELAKQEFIYFWDKITHAGWFMSWQFRLADRYIKRGVLYYAIEKGGAE